ncbi:MAG: hypothetical protein KatS3mg097_267 [Candidatus Parcubacteria bacterium]|nr:MAG: hypothetical protein KatS3mg097_267 [Candidatus Parcubacteria bacterium]
MKLINNKEKAFTLAEIIIALLIIGISVAALTRLAINYIVSLSLAKEQLLAIYVTQEGLELATALRNSAPTGSNNRFQVPINTTSNAISTYCLDFNSSSKEITTTTDCAVSWNRKFTREIIYQTLARANPGGDDYIISIMSSSTYNQEPRFSLNQKIVHTGYIR